MFLIRLKKSMLMHRFFCLCGKNTIHLYYTNINNMINQKEQIRIDIMSEILDKLEIHVSFEQVQEIVKRFMVNLEMIDESDLYAYSVKGTKKEVCKKCLELEKETDGLKNTIEIFKNSVKKRTGATNVWIDSKEVMYNYR